MKFVVRPYHILSLGGYIVEWDFPYRNLILVNPTDEPIKVDIPVFDMDWFKDNGDLGLDITPVSEEDNYLAMYKREYAKLEKIKSELSSE